MESLRDRINKAKQQEEQQKRDENPYQTAMSPNGVGTSSPDVAKMAGTPNQKQSTMESVTEVVSTPESPTPPPSTVQQAQQQAMPRTDDLMMAHQMPRDFEAEATAERAKGWSEAMQGFGSLGGRVEQLIMSQMSGQQMGDQNAIGQADFELNDEMVSRFAAPGQEEAVRAAFQLFSRAQTPEEAFQALADASDSFADPSTAIVDILREAYKNDPEAHNQMVANAISQNIIDPDQITIDQLVQGGMLTTDESGMIVELGMTEQQVQELLGPNWASLTPAQIEQQLNEFQEENLNNRQKIMEQLADPTLDPAARAGLIEELKVMGAVGELEAEQVAEESKQIAADSGKLVIGGEVKDVVDLLEDENIQQDVKNYLMGGEMSEEWAEANPEFAAWIDRELEDMKGQAAQLDERLERFAEIQKENESFVEYNVADQAGGEKLKEEVMKVFGFDDEGFQAGQFDPASSELYSALLDIGDESMLRGAVQALNQLSPLALEELKGEFLTSPEGAKEFVAILADKEQRDTMVRALALPGKIDQMTSPDAMIREVTGHDRAALQKTMNTLRLNSLLGDTASQAKYDMLTKMFDSNGDGKLDTDPEALKASIKAAIGTGSIQDLMGDGKLSGINAMMNSGNDSTYSGSQKDLASELTTYFKDDGIVSPDELSKLSEIYNNDTQAGLAVLRQFRDNPELMQSLGMDPNAVQAEHTKMLNRDITQRITSNVLPLNDDGTFGDIFREGITQLEINNKMSNKATAEKYLKAQNTLRDIVNDESRPAEERKAAYDAYVKIRSGTNFWHRGPDGKITWAIRRPDDVPPMKFELSDNGELVPRKAITRKRVGNSFVDVEPYYGYENWTAGRG